MKEYIFRAWDKDADCFAYSDQENDSYIWGFEDGKLKAWVIVESFGTQDEPAYHSSVELAKPDQYTNLNDKDNIRLYENDILEYDGDKCPHCGKILYGDHDLYIIVWNEKSARFECRNFDNFLSSDIWHTDMKKIGNIWKNPKLFEGRG